MPTLKQIIGHMLVMAEANPGVPQRVKLARCLHVSIKLDDGVTYLQLHRAGTYPSQQEMETVLKSFPYQVGPTGKQNPMHLGGRYYLSTRWPTPARLMENAK